MNKNLKCTEDDLTRCQKCIYYRDGTYSKLVPYSNFPCTICDAETQTLVPATKVCETCTDVTQIDNASGKVTKLGRSKYWTKLPDRDDCTECKDKGGKEEWVSKCFGAPGEFFDCIQGKCIPVCAPACNPVCEQCEEPDENASRKRKRKCKDICTDKKNFTCIHNTITDSYSCECKLVQAGDFAETLGYQACSADKPYVRNIIGRTLFSDEETVVGCECYCNITAEDCLSQGKIFDGANCICKASHCATLSDPNFNCDASKCEECKNVKGKYDCYTKCLANQSCVDGTCYDIPRNNRVGINSLTFIP